MVPAWVLNHPRLRWASRPGHHRHRQRAREGRRLRPGAWIPAACPGATQPTAQAVPGQVCTTWRSRQGAAGCQHRSAGGWPGGHASPTCDQRVARDVLYYALLLPLPRVEIKRSGERSAETQQERRGGHGGGSGESISVRSREKPQRGLHLGGGAGRGGAGRSRRSPGSHGGGRRSGKGCVDPRSAARGRWLHLQGLHVTHMNIHEHT